MKKFLKWGTGITLVLIVIGIFLLNHFGPTLGAKVGMPIYIFPLSATRYGEIAIEIMDDQGYFVNEEEWSKQKKQAMNELANISNYEEAYPIIEEALKIAGGKHSFLLQNEEKEATYAKDMMPQVERNANVLFVQLPAIMDAEKNGKKYAEIVLEALNKNKEIKGIVIDLQENTGGDMGPMITAVSPLLPDGEILYFEHHLYDQPVVLKNGEVTGGGTTITTDIPSFKMDVPVAILTNERTGSSAEAIAMSFLDLENVRTFGQPTAGYASGNASYPLYDRSILYLTVAYNKTVNGQVFFDEPIPVDLETDNPREEAVNWLNSSVQ